MKGLEKCISDVLRIAGEFWNWSLVKGLICWIDINSISKGWATLDFFVIFFIFVNVHVPMNVFISNCTFCSLLVVVHFYAPWAPQCKQMNDVMGELAKEHVHVKFYKVSLCVSLYLWLYMKVALVVSLWASTCSPKCFESDLPFLIEFQKENSFQDSESISPSLNPISGSLMSLLTTWLPCTFVAQDSVLPAFLCQSGRSWKSARGFTQIRYQGSAHFSPVQGMDHCDFCHIN